MFGTAYEILKRQRLACASAMIVALFLVFIAHAPILPVVAGCLLAMGLAVLRSLSRQTKNISLGRGQ